MVVGSLAAGGTLSNALDSGRETPADEGCLWGTAAPCWPVLLVPLSSWWEPLFQSSASRLLSWGLTVVLGFLATRAQNH